MGRIAAMLVLVFVLYAFARGSVKNYYTILFGS